MALLDFISNRNAAPQQSVAQNTQSKTAPAPTVESLPAHVKAQAVEAARPAAELMDKATQHQNSSSAPSQVTPANTAVRARGLGMER